MKTIILATFMLSIMGAANAQGSSESKSKSVEFLNSAQAGTANLPFSEAVRVGDMLFLSGQIGVNTLTGKLVPGGIRAEARQAMENIKRSLNVHGYSMSNIVKCTVMLADIAEWQTFNEVYVSYFSKPYPARSAFGANGLGLNSRVEIECIAVINE